MLVTLDDELELIMPLLGESVPHSGEDLPNILEGVNTDNGLLEGEVDVEAESLLSGELEVEVESNIICSVGVLVPFCR